MNDSNQSGRSESTIEMEIYQDDIQNCIALSVDSRIEKMVELTSDIEELLGLQSDKEFRMQRVNLFRQRAVAEGIPPVLDPEFSVKVENYCSLLQSKKAILLSMYKCCEDFCLAMHNELEAINQSFANNPEERAAFVDNYMRSSCSRSRCSKLASGKHQRRNRLPSHALTILWDFVRTHKKNPYPSTQQKEALARQTNLTMTQIRNWFTNTRKRKLSQAPESDEDYSIGSDNEDSYPSPPPEESAGRRSLKRRAVGRNAKTAKARKQSVDLTPVLPLPFAPNAVPDDAPQNRTANASHASHAGRWIQHAEGGMLSSVDSGKSSEKMEEAEAPLEMKTESASHVGTPRFDRDFSLFEPGSIPNSGIGFSLSHFSDDPLLLGLSLGDLQDNEFFNNNPIAMRKKDGEEGEAIPPHLDEERVDVNSDTIVPSSV